MASSPLAMVPVRRMSQTPAGVRLQRVAAGGGFRAAEHHADLHCDLVDEDDRAVGLLMVAVSLRSAWLYQAGLVAGAVAISPSISALGTRAATGSPRSDRPRPSAFGLSTISSACSPVSGWLMSRVQQLHAQFWRIGVQRVPASKRAGAADFASRQSPASVSVVSRRLRGHKFRSHAAGRPPTPSAMSRPSEPVETTWMSSMASPSPRRMMNALKTVSICASAAAGLGLFRCSRAGGVGTFDVHGRALE